MAHDIGPNLTAAALTTVLIATLVVSARLWARARIAKAIGVDDWLMLLALLLAIVSTGTEIISVEKGFGLHIGDAKPANISTIFKYVGISGAFCNMSLTFAKLSIIATLLRILSGAHRRGAVIFLYVLGFSILGVNVTVTGTQYGQCHPIERVWNKKVYGSCWSPHIQADLSYLQGAYSAFTDFVLALIPAIVFGQLKLNRRQRYALIGVMSLGHVTGALAIARTVQTWRYSGVNDPTYTTVTLLMLSALERNFAIILGSVPQCKPLFRSGELLSSLGSATLSFFKRSGSSGSDPSLVESKRPSDPSTAAATPSTKQSVERFESATHLV